MGKTRACDKHRGIKIPLFIKNNLRAKYKEKIKKVLHYTSIYEIIQSRKGKEEVNIKKEFNDFRFEGLDYKEASNEYFTMNRVSEDETKIIVKVDLEHLIQTKYGFALILDNTRVVFLKDWQVDINYFGNEILLTKEYFNVKVWGNHEEFEENDSNCEWETLLTAAKTQANIPVKWRK